MAPFCLPKSTKIHQKSTPRGIKILIVFCFDFSRFWLRYGSQVGAMLATFFEPRRPQDAPRRPQDGHKTPQDAPKTPQDAPRRSETLQDAPKAPKTTPGRRFWDDFRETLEDFWKIFGGLFGRISPPDHPCLEARGCWLDIKQNDFGPFLVSTACPQTPSTLEARTQASST